MFIECYKLKAKLDTEKTSMKEKKEEAHMSNGGDKDILMKAALLLTLFPIPTPK